MKNRANIAINGTYLHKNPSGLGIYTYELIMELMEANSRFNFTIFSSSHDLKKLFPDRVTLVNPWTSAKLGFRGHLMRFLWQQTILPFKLGGEKGLLVLFYRS